MEKGSLHKNVYTLLSETLSNQTTSYSYDLLGRVTQISYPNSGSKSISYTPDGYVSSFSGEEYTYDKTGNITGWEDNTNEVVYSYSNPGSKQLGLPSSAIGSGDIGDYSFTYNTDHWLYELTDTSKAGQQYTYYYSSSKELTQLSCPNSLQLHQTWTSKRLDLITVTDYLQQNTYLSSDATYNSNKQMTDYDYLVNAGQNSFSESYDITYDILGRISTIETDSLNRTQTFDYDSGNGKLASLQYSDLGSYSIDYLINGNIDSITYPNNQGDETYSYNGGEGRISQIIYPNDDIITFHWNDLDEVTQLIYYENDTQVTTQYVLTYTLNHQLKSITQSIDSIQKYVWNLTWAPNGLEKAVKKVNSQTVLSQDFTTDPSGRILSMTYSTPGEGYDGELYLHYDHFGNTTLLTDIDGDPIASFQYDLQNGKKLNEWNPNGLLVINTNNGKFGDFTVEKPDNGQISFSGDHLKIVDICPLLIENKLVVNDIPDILKFHSPCDPYSDESEEETESNATTPDQQWNECMDKCYKNKTGMSDWKHQEAIYSQWSKMQQDYTNLTYNITVVLSGLTGLGLYFWALGITGLIGLVKGLSLQAIKSTLLSSKSFQEIILNIEKIITKVSTIYAIGSYLKSQIGKAMYYYYESRRISSNMKDYLKAYPWLNDNVRWKKHLDAYSNCQSSCAYLKG